MKTESILQHKVDAFIREIAGNESYRLENGIDGENTVTDTHLSNYAETVCNELVGELERAGVIEVLNDQ